MTAIRSVRAAEGKFVQISNAALQDERLSWSARGILAFVLSLPPDQHLTAAWLEKQAPDGRRAIRSALRELETCGYYRRVRTSSGGTWTWEQVISDAPIDSTPGEDDESPQVTASDRFAPDADSSDAIPSDKRSNTEDPKDVGPIDMASRHARAKKRASTQRDLPTIIREVRAAAAQEYGNDTADWLSDEDALGLYCSKKGSIPAGNLVAYMAKIMADAPSIDSLLANSEAVCVTCVQWESDCKCPVAA